jgi:ankyrin repeat protein
LSSISHICSFVKFIYSKISEPFNRPTILSKIIDFASVDAKELKRLQGVSSSFQDVVQFHASDTHKRTITQEVLNAAGNALDRTILHNALKLRLPLNYNDPILTFARAGLWNEVFAIIDIMGVNWNDEPEREGAAVNLVPEREETALHIAVEQRNIEVAEKLLRAGIIVDLCRTHKGRRESTLTIACDNNDIEMVKLLVLYKANPTAIPDRAGNPINVCCMRGYLDILKVIFGPDHYDVMKPSPVYVASAHGHVHIIRYFASHNINFNRLTEQGKGDPMKIAYINKREESIDALLEGGYRFDKHSWSQTYIQYPDSRLLRKLFKAGLPIVNPEQVMSIYLTSIYIILDDARAFIDLLIECGVDLVKQTNGSERYLSAVQLAIRFRAYPLLEILLDYDEEALKYAIELRDTYALDIIFKKMKKPLKNLDDILRSLCREGLYQYIQRIIDIFELTPEDLDGTFIAAVASGNHNLLKGLLEVGMNPNEVFIDASNLSAPPYTPYQPTVDIPVFHMILYHDQTTARLLMEYGANPNIRYKIYGRETSVFEETIIHNQRIAQYIYENGGIVTERILERLTEDEANYKFVRWLIQHPIKPLDRNATITKDDKVYGLLDKALYAGQFVIVALLKKNGFQYKLYTPEEIAWMEEMLIAKNGHIEI